MPLIVFEGIDGSGKSTVSNQLAQYLHQKGAYTLWYREPGGTMLGEVIRTILKFAKKISIIKPRTEFFLFQAARSQLLYEVNEHLKQGRYVILDRFTLSTMVYQVVLNGIPTDTAYQISRYASYDLIPDITILLDLPVDVAIDRLSKRDDNDGGYDGLEPQAMQELRDHYLDLARVMGPMVKVVDANRKTVFILEDVIEIVEKITNPLGAPQAIFFSFSDLNPSLHVPQVNFFLEILTLLIKGAK